MRTFVPALTLLLASSLAASAAGQDGDAETMPARTNPRAVLQTTLGDMTLELYADKAPLTVANFLQYAQSGHYDNTMFHRVIKGFMAQGGGLLEGYVPKQTRKAISNEADNGLKNTRLTVAMARLGEPHSATSQFFINDGENVFLDHTAKTKAGWGYCVFGKIVDGVDTYEKLINGEVKVDQRADVQSPAALVTPVLITGVQLPDETVIATIMARAEQVERERQEAEAAARQDALKEGIELVKSKGADVSTGSTSDTGLWSLDTVEGSGGNPGPTDRVTVHYTGWLTNGTKFDSSHDRGQPATFPLNGVIAGWTEGVGGMKPGGKRYLVIPFELAYGAAGRPPTIPARATLVFEVELISIAGR